MFVRVNKRDFSVCERLNAVTAFQAQSFRFYASAFACTVPGEFHKKSLLPYVQAGNNKNAVIPGTELYSEVSPHSLSRFPGS